jgi:hypothetical protein
MMFLEKEEPMTEPKTKPTDFPVSDFINLLPDVRVRQDCWTLIDMMQEEAHAKPVMWGTAIVGFGTYPITGSDGKTNDWPVIGFSPRKQALTLYLNLKGMMNLDEMLAKLGKHTRSKGCLYIKRISDVDLATLKEIIQSSVESTIKNHKSAPT